MKNDLSGKKFGKLLVIELFKLGGNGRHNSWKCKCDCGNYTITNSSSLKSGHTKSCGCLKIEVSTKHGMTKTNTYKSWSHMKDRCYNPNDSAWINYGGRGITVCQKWLESFENFYSDMGDCPKGLEIDRINNNGNYEPNNCKWSTTHEQSRNRRSNINITYNGKTQCAKDWSSEFNIEYKLFIYRLKAGWDLEKALTTKSGKSRKNEILVTINGITQNITDWAKECKVSRTKIYNKINYSKDSPENIITLFLRD